jgi:hypothetical protein
MLREAALALALCLASAPAWALSFDIMRSLELSSYLDTAAKTCRSTELSALAEAIFADKFVAEEVKKNEKETRESAALTCFRRPSRPGVRQRSRLGAASCRGPIMPTISNRTAFGPPGAHNKRRYIMAEVQAQSLILDASYIVDLIEGGWHRREQRR